MCRFKCLPLFCFGPLFGSRPFRPGGSSNVSGYVEEIEWFDKDSVNAALHGNREYFAFDDLTPVFYVRTFATQFYVVRVF